MVFKGHFFEEIWLFNSHRLGVAIDSSKVIFYPAKYKLNTHSHLIIDPSI